MKKNSHSKWYALVVFLCISLGAKAQMPQTPQDVKEIKRIIHVVDSLFKEKRYKETIIEADKGLSMYGEVKDSLYIELLRNKYLCYSYGRLYQNPKAIKLCVEAIKIYESFNKKDQMMSHLYSDYCHLVEPSYDKDFYYHCVFGMFKTKHIHINNFELYEKILVSLYGDLDNEEKERAIENERQKLESINIPILYPYLKYLQACLLSYTEHYFSTSKEDKFNALLYLKEAEEGLKRYNNNMGYRLLYDVLDLEAKIYEHLGQNAAAAYKHKEILDLTSKYWEKWGHESPWSLGANYGNGKMARFENYSEQLSIEKMYQSIVDYCCEVLEDPRLFKAGDNCYLVVLETLEDAYKNMGDSKKGKEIADRIVAFQNGKESNIQKNAVDDTENKYELLLKEKKYDDIIKITTNIIDSFIKDVHESDRYSFLFSKKDVESGRCTMTELEIDNARDEWHHANGIRTAWESYYYRALAYLSKGNYEKAIKDQQRVVEIVRLDWKYEENERANVLCNYQISIICDEYIYTELDMIMQMAYMYLKAGKHSEAFTYYKKAININLQVLQTVLSIGSQSVKEEEWYNRNYIYYNIIGNLSDAVKEYPRYADLILEANAVLKGFLLNFVLRTQDAIFKSDSQTQKESENKNKADKLIELSCYDSAVDLKDAILKSQNATIAINNSIDMAKIIRESQEDLSTIRKKLLDGDVLVDFFYIHKGQFIEKDDKIEEMIDNNNDTLEIKTVYNYFDYHLYANVFRKAWEHPKLVYMGKISDAIISDTGKDLIDYVYFDNNKSSEINELYKSTTLTHFIWDKIIIEGQIKENDNIYFIPSGIFNRIAIESLPINTKNLIADFYNIHRLSSIRELHHSESVYNENYRCVAFGDITYNLANNKMLSRPHHIISETLAANPEAILDRSVLNELESTKSVIETISNVVNNAKIVSGTFANEKAFYELSGHSPEILFLGTHGYNFERSELKEKEKKYLFGDRGSVYLSDSEKGMYTSGLYLAPSNSLEIATDGMLTAKEICLQDFSNTKLAVLSACSTAIGISSQDGVYGVQRGFKMAGVKSIIASLWDVDAKATQLLMTEFFKQYSRGTKIHKSLRIAQQFVRDYVDDSDNDNTILRAGQGKIYANPYFWAGFILIE